MLRLKTSQVDGGSRIWNHKAHLWFSGSVGQGNLPTAAKVVQLGWEFS
jgi:hypothetical protein